MDKTKNGDSKSQPSTRTVRKRRFSSPFSPSITSSPSPTMENSSPSSLLDSPPLKESPKKLKKGSPISSPKKEVDTIEGLVGSQEAGLFKYHDLKLTSKNFRIIVLVHKVSPVPGKNGGPSLYCNLHVEDGLQYFIVFGAMSLMKDLKERTYYEISQCFVGPAFPTYTTVESSRLQLCCTPLTCFSEVSNQSFKIKLAELTVAKLHHECITNVTVTGIVLSKFQYSRNITCIVLGDRSSYIVKIITKSNLNEAVAVGDLLKIENLRTGSSFDCLFGSPLTVFNILNVNELSGGQEIKTWFDADQFDLDDYVKTTVKEIQSISDQNVFTEVFAIKGSTKTLLTFAFYFSCLTVGCGKKLSNRQCRDCSAGTGLEFDDESYSCSGTIAFGSDNEIIHVSGFNHLLLELCGFTSGVDGLHQLIEEEGVNGFQFFSSLINRNSCVSREIVIKVTGANRSSEPTYSLIGFR